MSVAGTCVVWQWESGHPESCVWTDFEPDFAKDILERNYQFSITRFQHLRTQAKHDNNDSWYAKVTYEFNLDDMHQINYNTGTIRRLRRMIQVLPIVKQP